MSKAHKCPELRKVGEQYSKKFLNHIKTCQGGMQNSKAFS